MAGATGKFRRFMEGMKSGAENFAESGSKFMGKFVEKTGKKDYMTGLKLSPLGKAAILGAAVVVGTRESIKMSNQNSLGQINSAVNTPPQMLYDYNEVSEAKGGFEGAADGDLVLALSKLRRG